MDLAQIKVYRMTHIDNVPYILQHGITHKNSISSNPDFITIGDVSLINTRTSKQVSVDNGDFSNFGAPSIVLGDFIPFYFGIKMPMLYVMQHGGNFVEQATPPENIVYLVCSIIRIIEFDINYYFSDGHATDNYTTFYNKSSINELPALIDWKAVKASYWGGEENLNIKRKKQAEFLVSSDLPPDFITGFGCYNDPAKKKLTGMGIEEEKIRIIPGAYY